MDNLWVAFILSIVEGLTEYQVFGQSELKACGPYLILEEQPQRLDDLLEVHMLGKSAYIVMGLYDCTLSKS